MTLSLLQIQSILTICLFKLVGGGGGGGGGIRFPPKTLA